MNYAFKVENPLPKRILSLVEVNFADNCLPAGLIFIVRTVSILLQNTSVLANLAKLFFTLRTMDFGVLITDFSGAFRREYFLPDEASLDLSFESNFEVLDFTSLEGVKSYCDAASAAEISRRISPFCFPSEKWRDYPIHIIDTGEYHYLSKLFTDPVDIPYTLLMFDNHTDLQAPAFGGILSCGGWLREAMLTSRTLQKVLLTGPEGRIARYQRLSSSAPLVIPSPPPVIPSEAKESLPPGIFPPLIGKFALVAEAPLTTEGLEQICSNDLGDALYISIDKDIMSSESYLTDWSQGTLSLAELKSLLFTVLHPLFGGDTLATSVSNGLVTSAPGLTRRLLGVDICGGLSPQHPTLTCDASLNRRTDLALLSALLLS